MKLHALTLAARSYALLLSTVVMSESLAFHQLFLIVINTNLVISLLKQTVPLMFEPLSDNQSPLTGVHTARRLGILPQLFGATVTVLYTMK